MKICKCGVSNSNEAKFCSECGLNIDVPPTDALIPAPPAKLSPKDASMAIAERDKKKALATKRQADIMFVLDCTGSMQGEIDAIRDAMVSFTETIKSDGVRVRVGLVEFRDRLINEEHRALKFAGEVFTDNPDLFRQQVTPLKAGGGGDEPESSLDALMLALQQPFSPDAQKVIVLVTDAPPHIPDKETKDIETVVNKIGEVGLEQLYLVIRVKNSENKIYLKLLEKTRGLAFDLGQGDDFRQRTEDFKRTLMNLGKTISSMTR